ncbi:Activator of Hsp90 ATPase homolog 1-like protein [Dyadobacter koreensis]|uniref:Activator of Hsp90 ATPase homolog 1-like protein n=1 Tax=Dyadobacter koreensis TaxID=408657 RepID=A0A1H6S5G5_9BACT|nr:SRPBCC domain-containing protein [Dyadobacter koreensis]SEI58965.1 Activator of Hsp90 ATPase homolog 1-like protein [Dyadobacter koreensis]
MDTEMKRIKKSVLINAPKEKVWDVLFTDRYTRIWYTAFGEGSRAETDWKVGSKAIFSDESNSGLIGEVIANEANEKLSVEYKGILNDNKEDYESDMANQIKGGRETYHISEEDGVTYLEIESDMGAEYFEEMSKAWVSALQKVKSLAES